MSGFSPEWLALREPADHAARDPRLLAEVAGRFAGRPSLSIVDLGCGAGSNLRGMAAHLPGEQAWTLVDYDARLLDAARAALRAWADEARDEGDALVLAASGKRLSVTFRQADLSGDVGPVLTPKPDLVTAAALFDLVSEPWLRRFTATLAERRLPLYTVLTYDGLERWQPPHPLDAAILAAFHTHQTTDKGFGVASGPRAAGHLAASFSKLGYRVRSGDSPWRLGPDQRDLIGQLAAGIAGAAAQTGRVSRIDAEAWAQARRDAAAEIGHRDIFAEPD
jgi:hypothetical protein